MTRMTFEEAINFIMERLDVPAHARRATRDKVRKRVRFGLGDGKLPRLDLQTMDVDRDELVHWARTKWPGKFEIPISLHAHAREGVAFNANADGMTLPLDVEQCHIRIREVESRNRLLKILVHQQTTVIADLRPLAEQYQRNRAKNRASARKPRTG